jgi:hypothetical protein
MDTIKTKHTFTQPIFIDGACYVFAVTVDTKRIAEKLGPKALKAKGKRSTLARDAIVVIPLKRPANWLREEGDSAQY